MYKLEIDLKKYPELSKHKKSSLDKTVKEIFDKGYNLLYPIMDTNENLILSKLNTIENNSPHINELNKSISQLLGITSNSSRKGELGEQIVEQYINKKYGKSNYIVKRSEDHCGDGWLNVNNNNIIVEVKAYSSTVNIKEIDKLKYDMEYNNINIGIMISIGSDIQGSKLVDLEVFNIKNKKCYIIKVSHISENYDLLDIGFNIMENINKLEIDKKNSVILLEENLLEKITVLHDKIKKTTKLRELFQNMSLEINSKMDLFYSELTNLYLEQEYCVKQICNEINKNSINKLEINSNNIIELEKFKIYKIYNNLLKKIYLLNRLKIKFKITDNKIFLENCIIKILKDKLQINIQNPLITLYIISKTNNGNSNKENFKLMEKLL